MRVCIVFGVRPQFVTPTDLYSGLPIWGTSEGLVNLVVNWVAGLLLPYFMVMFKHLRTTHLRSRSHLIDTIFAMILPAKSQSKILESTLKI